MNLGGLFAKIFEKIPEWRIKNNLRYFLAFSPLIPSFIKDISPVRGYWLCYKLKQGDIVVDAGAYPGDYAVFAAKKVGESGRVIAFEPDVKNRKILTRNIKREGLKNVIVVPRGLWNKNTTLNFKSSDGLHSTLYSENVTESIEVVKLDDILKKLKIKKINVLKMDIEGAEIEAIKGAVSTLKKNKVQVMIASYHIVKGKRTSYFIENFLRKIGYKAESIFQKHLTTHGWKD